MNKLVIFSLNLNINGFDSFLYGWEYTQTSVGVFVKQNLLNDDVIEILKSLLWSCSISKLGISILPSSFFVCVLFIEKIKFLFLICADGAKVSRRRGVVFATWIAITSCCSDFGIDSEYSSSDGRMILMLVPSLDSKQKPPWPAPQISSFSREKFSYALSLGS